MGRREILLFSLSSRMNPSAWETEFQRSAKRNQELLNSLLVIVFQKEIQAIAISSKEMLDIETITKRYLLMIGQTGCTQDTGLNQTISLTIVSECRKKLDYLNLHNTRNVLWVPGHSSDVKLINPEPTNGLFRSLSNPWGI